ncbi:Dipeptidyl aminopeptidase BIII [Calidithermus terrae]|uniref:Dipeptidyl aminopeptidase BIII n=1 Tax=Calidithermus terrae TaxID=1408545 RepID=A0A399EVB9_9DEIN|nr:S9 family peptidase [Calidithermus terrae]RIH87530.1 Dipeptidyl aminopeptidase BIII [Calidithermus terrae]
MVKERIPLEELARLPNFAAVTPSWSADRIAFYWDKTGRFELYVMDLQTRQVRQLTDGQAPRQLRAGFVWTRDDREIIFAKDHQGDEQNNLFKLELATGRVVQMNHDPKTQEYAGEVHPDNRRMAVMSNRAGQMNVFVLELASENHEWKQLTRFKAPAFAGRWSPDGRWLALASNESPNLKNQDGYLVRDDGSEVRKVFSVREGSQDQIADWHPDGVHVAVTSDASGNNRPGILNLETGEVRWLGPGTDQADEYAGSFSKSGEWLVTLRNQDASIFPVLYRVATGEERTLRLPGGMAFGTSFVLDDSKLLITHSSARRRPELLLYDLQTDAYEVLLPAEYGSIDPAVFVDDEYVRYPTFDGQQVPAILYRPRDVAPGARLPALVIVHGGPTAQFFRGFDPYAQFLADRGYVILQPNIRGSTGYGTAWRDANLKDWGGGDLEDVVAGANYLKSLPYVDPERVGIFGGSFGGFMSFIAVTKRPDVFKVGVPWVGISDLHLLYEEDMEHFKYYLRQQMGDPEKDYALWRDRSAVEFAHQLTAKLLIVHGTNDPRCPISQARVFRDRLLQLGKREGEDFEYHEFGDEGHGPGGDIQGKIRTYRLLADFLERRL